MLVRITEIDTWDDDITVGEEYEVIREDWTGVTFVDAVGDVNYVSKGQYEIVEE